MNYDVRVREIVPRTVLALRQTTTPDRLGDVIGVSLSRLCTEAGRHGYLPRNRPRSAIPATSPTPK